MITRTTKKGKGFTLLELMMVIAAIAAIAFVLLPALSRPRRTSCYINCVNNLKQVGLSFRLWDGDNGEKYPMQVVATSGGPAQQSSIADGSGAAYLYQVFQVMSNELGTPKIVVCPEDKDRNIATNFGGHFDALGNAGISYFVGKDADEAQPQLILAGDRNIGLKPTQGWGGNTSGSGPTGFSPLYGKAGNYLSLSNYAMDPRLQWTDRLHQGKGNVVLSDGSVQQLDSIKMRAAITSSSNATWAYFP